MKKLTALPSEMKFFKIIDRPYGSEAEFCYSTEDGFFITDKGTCISSKESDHYSFEENILRRIRGSC